MMPTSIDKIANDITSILDKLAPDAPITEIVDAILKTITNPSIPVIEEDISLAFQLAMNLKQSLSGKHSGLWQIVQMIFHMMPEEKTP